MSMLKRCFFTCVLLGWCCTGILMGCCCTAVGLVVQCTRAGKQCALHEVLCTFSLLSCRSCSAECCSAESCSAECLGMPLTATPATHHRTVKQIIPLCLQHKIRLCLQHSIPLRQRAPCYLSWHIAVRYVSALCVCDMCLRLTIACYLCMCVVLCGWWLFGTSLLCARTHGTSPLCALFGTSPLCARTHVIS